MVTSKKRSLRNQTCRGMGDRNQTFSISIVSSIIQPLLLTLKSSYNTINYQILCEDKCCTEDKKSCR